MQLGESDGNKLGVLSGHAVVSLLELVEGSDGCVSFSRLLLRTLSGATVG